MKYTKKFPIHPKPDKQFSGASIFKGGGWLDEPTKYNHGGFTHPEDDFLNSLINQKQTTSVDNTKVAINPLVDKQSQQPELQQLWDSDALKSKQIYDQKLAESKKQTTVLDKERDSQTLAQNYLNKGKRDRQAFNNEQGVQTGQADVMAGVDDPILNTLTFGAAGTMGKVGMLAKTLGAARGGIGGATYGVSEIPGLAYGLTKAGLTKGVQALGNAAKPSISAAEPGVKIGITGRPIVEKQFTAAVENVPTPNKWLNTSDSFGTMEQGVVKGPPSTQESIMKSFTGKEPQFKSEIDWAKWNKEIPENASLMQEYNAIEQQAKANNSWMKNPDGSDFNGTPEQFVQQNSSNFKKAFPNGNDITYRGSTNQMSKKGFLNEDKVNGSIFTANKEAAISYGPGKRSYTEGAVFKTPEDTGNKVHELYYPISKNSINIDNQGRSWRELSKDIMPRPKDYIDKYGDLKSASYKYRDTDELAKYLEDNNIDNATIKNIFDGIDVEKEVILNHKPGNYLKSTFGNNGMFDMTNPNIYKAVIPAAIGTTALTNEKKYGGWLENYK